MLVFNLWPALPVFYFFSTSFSNFSCNCVTGFSVLNQFDVVQNVFFYHYEVWLLGRDFSRHLSFAAGTLLLQEKKKKMLRIFFQVLQVADEAYFNKIQCRCVLVLSSLVRTCKSHVQKDAGWCWSLSFTCRNDGRFEAEKDRPCPQQSVQTFVCRLSADYSSHTV